MSKNNLFTLRYALGLRSRKSPAAPTRSKTEGVKIVGGLLPGDPEEVR